MLKETYGSTKPIIAMVHFPSLPGAPLYDAKRGMNAILDSAAADIEKLQAGGVDCVMFGNEGDRPYILKASPESLAAFGFAVGQLKREIKVPFGVDYLWDPIATVGLAVNSLATLGFHHALGLPPTIAKTCGVGVAFLVNFAMNSAIVFRPVRTGRPAASPARMTASRRQRPS